MYRFITLLLFVNFASCTLFHKFEDGYGLCLGLKFSTLNQLNAGNDFESLAQAVEFADNLVKTSCATSTYRRTRVYQDLDFYRLKYHLQEFNENSISVKIKNRVIYVTAQGNGIDTFKDLRILPEFVKTTDANWYFEDGLLQVLLPYKNPLKTEVILTCGDTHQSVINVPKPESPDLRFLPS